MQGKLVRDYIPEIIRREGLTPIVEVATADDYRLYVRAKLAEELQEYLASEDVGELADLVEVCFAAAAAHGVDSDRLLQLAAEKRERNGGFAGRVIWKGNLPASQ